MHYYLYPKGINAKVVAWGLENFFENTSFSFIDDSDSASSLEANLEAIKKASRVEKQRFLYVLSGFVM